MNYIMKKFGLIYHGIKINDTDYLKNQKASYSFWDNNHFVVFINIKEVISM